MQKLRMGMVGGGNGAFIGAVHRLAAQMDGQIELVCGAFNSDPQRSKESGKSLYIDEQRCYGDYIEMFESEALKPEGERMDFVSIVTPNHLHYPVAKKAIECGFHVISDKPATLNLQQALDLKSQLSSSQSLYALTHVYTGYPMVREARERVLSDELGAIKSVVVEYSQGWLAAADAAQNKQAEWRLDPARAGASCCMGDIGVHAAHLAEFITDSQINEVSSFLGSSQGRVLDDEGAVILRLANGAQGVLMASQVAVGEENNLKIRVYGEHASLEWAQQEPNTLWMKFQDKPTQILRAGVGELSEAAINSMRTPAGHPEGYLEAFGNIYKDFAGLVRQQANQNKQLNSVGHVPGIEDAISGMAFIETAVNANKSNVKWHPVLREVTNVESLEKHSQENQSVAQT